MYVPLQFSIWFSFCSLHNDMFPFSCPPPPPPPPPTWLCAWNRYLDYGEVNLMHMMTCDIIPNICFQHPIPHMRCDQRSYTLLLCRWRYLLKLVLTNRHQKIIWIVYQSMSSHGRYFENQASVMASGPIVSVSSQMSRFIWYHPLCKYKI